MKLREAALWRSFSKHIPADAMAVRVENSVDTGMPDTLIAYRKVTVLIELKAPASMTDLEITPVQADWARRWSIAGGTSWFLIALNHQVYLAPGVYGKRLIKNPTEIRRWQVANYAAAIQTILGAR